MSFWREENSARCLAIVRAVRAWAFSNEALSNAPVSMAFLIPLYFMATAATYTLARMRFSLVIFMRRIRALVISPSGIIDFLAYNLAAPRV